MFDELKNNWKKQKVENLPSVEDLQAVIGQKRAKIGKRILGAVLGIGFAILAFILIWYFIPFKYAMTQYAMLAMGVAMIAAVAYMLYMRNQIPQTSDTEKDAQKYIKHWADYKENMNNQSKSFSKIYTLIITAGMAVYLYEITEDNLILMVVAYSTTFAWILFVWFYLSPKWEKSMDDKVQHIIENYRAISEQLKD